MRDQETLPRDLLWQDDGHVTEVVLDTLADGQDQVVPTVAQEHVSACDLCSQRLGDAVLLAMRVGEALEQVTNTATVAHPKTWPIPVPALLAAVVLAAVGTIPALGELAARVTQLAYSLLAVIPNLTRAAMALSRTGDLGPQLALLSLVSIAILLISGFAIARAAPQEVRVPGGAR